MHLNKEEKELVRSQWIRARAELESTKHHPYFGCDVSGPYGHTWICFSCFAGRRSVKVAIRFRKDPGKPNIAAGHRSGSTEVFQAAG